MFLQTQGLLCKTGFDSQAQRPQVPVGRQAEAGGFVCLPWRLRNKAWDKASPGFRQGSLSKQARAGMAVEAVACMSLASPSSTRPVQAISGLLIVCLTLSHKWQMLLDLQAVLVVHWLSKSLLGNKVGKTGVQDTESKRWGGKSTDPESTGLCPRT